MENQLNSAKFNILLSNVVLEVGNAREKCRQEMIKIKYYIKEKQLDSTKDYKRMQR